MTALLRWVATPTPRPLPAIERDHITISVRPHQGRKIAPMDLPYAAQLLLRFEVEAAAIRRDIVTLLQRDYE